jgi:hypothetical protein
MRDLAAVNRSETQFAVIARAHGAFLTRLGRFFGFVGFGLRAVAPAEMELAFKFSPDTLARSKFA